MLICEIHVGQRLWVGKHLFDGRGDQLLWRGQIVEVLQVCAEHVVVRVAEGPCKGKYECEISQRGAEHLFCAAHIPLRG